MRSCRVTRCLAPGADFEYSNLGFGLLATTLALNAGKSYEDLVVELVWWAAGHDDTRITLRSRSAQTSRQVNGPLRVDGVRTAAADGQLGYPDAGGAGALARRQRPAQVSRRQTWASPIRPFAAASKLRARAQRDAGGGQRMVSDG